MSGSDADASSKGSAASSSPPESNASSKAPSASDASSNKPSSLKAVGRGIMLSIVIGAHIVLIPTGLFAVWLILRKEYYTVMTKGTILEVKKSPFAQLEYEYFAPTQPEPFRQSILFWHDEFSQYTKGQSIPVYYDPENPSNSSLKSDRSRSTGWYTLLVVVILLGVVWWGHAMANR